jgi:RNA polymerase sigma factor (sigma-70 family)
VIAVAVDLENEAAPEVAESFEAFYRATKDHVLRAVTVARRDPGGAEEAVAEAYARAYERWAMVSTATSPTAWVVRVALNVHASWWRRARRLVTLSILSGLAEKAWTGSEEPDLAAAVLRLPLRQRQVLALRVLGGLSTRETAETLGIAEGTVTAHLHRAVAALRRELAPTEGNVRNG